MILAACFKLRGHDTPQTDHPVLVGAVVDLNNDGLLLYRRNKYEQYGGYNLFQNAEFKANFSTAGNRQLVVLRIR